MPAHLRSAVLTAVTATLLCAAITPVAVAVPPAASGRTPRHEAARHHVDGNAVRAVQAVVDPTSRRHVRVRPDASTALATAHRVTPTAVRLPVDPSDPVTVGDTTYPVGISLPTSPGTADAEVAADGAFVSYARAGVLTDLVARPLGGAGAQILTVVHGPEAPTRFAYRFTLPRGSRLLAAPGGGVTVVNAAGAAVGSVAPAWAKDARGAPVPTRFLVAGSVLTQVVEHREGTAYPVVADPAYTRNCRAVSCTWYLSVLKTRDVARQLGAFPVMTAVALNVGAACSVAGVAGGPVAGVLCTAITSVGVSYVQAVFGAAARSRGCVTLSVGARAPVGRVGLSHRSCSWS